MMQSQSVNSGPLDTHQGLQPPYPPQSACNVGPSRGQAQRKRFDSVASPSASDQPSPSDILPPTQRARPDLRADCWNSPLCPRNMAANGATGSDLPQDCGPAKAQPAPSRTTSAAVEICADPSPASSTTDQSAKRIKLNPPSSTTDLSPDQATTPNPSKATEKRLPHHIIERRYRENLNISIEHLRAAVPTTTSCLTLDMEDIGSANPNAGIRPLSKAGVIAHAAEYMRQLAAQNEEVERANREMRVTVEALRRLVNCEDCGVVQRIVDAGTGGC